MHEEVVLKVKGDTNPNKLGGALVKYLKEGHKVVQVTGMGPHAVNQMVKGIIVGRTYLSAEAMDLEAVPGFLTRKEDGREVTLIVYRVSLKRPN